MRMRFRRKEKGTAGSEGLEKRMAGRVLLHKAASEKAYYVYYLLIESAISDYFDGRWLVNQPPPSIDLKNDLPL